MLYVISPHIDDALLSVGGLIKEFSEMDVPMTLEYVFSTSNWTNASAIGRRSYPRNEDEVSSIRRAEERNVALLFKYQYNCLGFRDSTARGVHGETDLHVLVRDVELRLRDLITPGALCMFPVGLDHIDHLIVRDVGLNLLDDGYDIGFYEDLPYAAGYRHSRIGKSKFNEDGGFISKLIKIDIQQKVNALKMYASQMSDEWISMVVRHSRFLHDGFSYERVWIRGKNCEDCFKAF